jgi:hypothetical protein
VLLGVLKKLPTSSGNSSKSDSSVSSASSESDMEPERRLRVLAGVAVIREVVLEGVGRLLLALPFLMGVAKMGAPGALRFTPLVAVAVRPTPDGPKGKWVVLPFFFESSRILVRRSLIARGVGPASSASVAASVRQNNWRTTAGTYAML